MYIVVTQSCLLVFRTVDMTLGKLEFWATLHSLEKLKRNMTYPNVVVM